MQLTLTKQTQKRLAHNTKTGKYQTNTQKQTNSEHKNKQEDIKH